MNVQRINAALDLAASVAVAEAELAALQARILRDREAQHHRDHADRLTRHAAEMDEFVKAIDELRQLIQDRARQLP